MGGPHFFKGLFDSIYCNVDFIFVAQAVIPVALIKLIPDHH